MASVLGFVVFGDYLIEVSVYQVGKLERTCILILTLEKALCQHVKTTWTKREGEPMEGSSAICQLSWSCVSPFSVTTGVCLHMSSKISFPVLQLCHCLAFSRDLKGKKKVQFKILQSNLKQTNKPSFATEERNSFSYLCENILSGNLGATLAAVNYLIPDLYISSSGVEIFWASNAASKFLSTSGLNK